jgi:hypothetical protein
MVEVIGYVEDERCFNNLNFYQIRTLQPVDNTSRPCGWMFAQQFLHVGEISIPTGSCNLEEYAN